MTGLLMQKCVVADRPSHYIHIVKVVPTQLKHQLTEIKSIVRSHIDKYKKRTGKINKYNFFCTFSLFEEEAGFFLSSRPAIYYSLSETAVIHPASWYITDNYANGKRRDREREKKKEREKKVTTQFHSEAGNIRSMRPLALRQKTMYEQRFFFFLPPLVSRHERSSFSTFPAIHPSSH